MKAAITGGAGFIGGHTLRRFLEMGADAFVIDDLSHGRAENVPNGVRLCQADIRDASAVNRILVEERPDVLIHLAAQISIPFSAADPATDAAVNILGTINCLEACRNNGVRKVVFASSAAVYGEPRYLPIDEEHQTKPLSGYGLSKLTAEGYLALYEGLCGLDWCALRYANVYGPGQDAAGEGGVVAVFHDRLKKGLPLTIYGDGGQTRDFVFVGDVAGANYLAAVSDATGVFNVGTGEPTSVIDLLNIIDHVHGTKTAPVSAPQRAGDIIDSRLSPKKIKTELGWKPERGLEEGLRQL